MLSPEMCGQRNNEPENSQVADRVNYFVSIYSDAENALHAKYTHSQKGRVCRIAAAFIKMK